MSNTPIPPSGAGGQNTSTNSTQAPPSNARIITLPEAIQARVDVQQQALTIRGQVDAVRADGIVRVRTDQGNVELQPREGRTPPARGQSVEITIQPRTREDAGRELRVNIRDAGGNTPEQRTSHTPVDVETNSETARQPLPADIRHAYSTQRAEGQPAPPPQSLPPEGTVVRLEPLPRAVAESLPPPDITQQVTATVIEPAVFRAQVLSAQIVNDTLAQTAQLATPRTAFQTPQVQIIQSFESGTPSQINAIPIATILPDALPQTLIQTPVQIVKSQIALRQNPNAFIQTTIQPATPQVAQIVAQPEAQAPTPQVFQTQTNPQTPAQPVALKAQPLNVSIDRIVPADALIVPAVQSSGASEALRVSTPQANALEVAQNAQTLKPETLILNNQSANSLTGIVTNITAGQLPVLSVFFPQLGSEQVFTLQFPSENITIGTQIHVTPQSVSQNTTAQSTAPAALTPLGIPLPAFLAAQPWPAMDEVLQTLARAAPQMASAMVASTPSPANPAQLTPAILFFVAAVRGGDITQWLGSKATDILKTQRGGQALNKLMGETQSLSRVAAEPTPQDWRALNVPIYHEGDMHKIGLFYRHESDEHEDSDAIKGTRFVFDLALDKMGKVQVDGLFRPVSDSGKRLDLVLRTEDIFAENTRAEMRQTYARALRDTGVTGELSFQNNPESWVTIQARDDNTLGVSA